MSFQQPNPSAAHTCADTFFYVNSCLVRILHIGTQPAVSNLCSSVCKTYKGYSFVFNLLGILHSERKCHSK